MVEEGYKAHHMIRLKIPFSIYARFLGSASRIPGVIPEIIAYLREMDLTERHFLGRIGLRVDNV